MGSPPRIPYVQPQHGVVEVMRGTPMLLQILMVYSGTKLIFNVDIDALTAAIVAIALNSAS